MNTIKSWIAKKPFTAVSLAALFGILATIAAFRSDWMPTIVVLYAIGLLIMALSMWRFTAVVLTAAIVALGMPVKADEKEPRFEPAGMAGVAVVVVVVGGVCVYMLVKTCQRLFPKTPAPSTNEPPNAVRSTDDTAGSWSYYGAVSCYVPQDDGPSWPQITMELSGTVEDSEQGPFFHLQASRKLSAVSDTQDYQQFQTDLARHGITLGPIGTQNFGRNGMPAYEEETPIRFTEVNGTHVATVYSDEAPSVPLVIQRSTDLKTWYDFGFVSTPLGQPFKLIDTTTGQSAFYRIQRR